MADAEPAPGATANGRPSGLRRARERLASPDGRAVSVLVALPLLLFVVPAAAGHPAIAADNLIQNFPLRELSGLEMRQGHLPLWNPEIWSGSPLLGGLNAGSFYPFTFAFVVLAPVAAWVVGLCGVYWAGGLGLYALCRQYRVRPLPSLLGALTYGFSGAMSGQIVHLGVVEGMGWMPLLVLAEVRLSWAVLGTGPVVAPVPDHEVREGTDAAPARRRSPWPWVALLAVVVALEALTGEPRAMAETEVVGIFVVAWLLVRPYGGRVTVGRRLAMVLYAAVGAAWGAALAAAELAPGWTFIQASQRAAESYWFFGSGSLRPAWSVLLFVPDLFGGAGLFGQPRFFNNYNLAEVTGYVGLLPLVALLVLLTRSFGRRRSPFAADWGMWLGLVAFGLVLAWGSYTPLGHIWAEIPLFGRTRLQSRNIAITDLGLAVVLAFWADRLLADRAAWTGTAGWRRWVAAVPPAVAVGASAAAWAFPYSVEEAFGATATGAYATWYLWPWFTLEMLIAAAVVALVFGWRRLRASWRQPALAALVVVDLAVFVLATSTVVEPPTVTLEPTAQAAAAVFGTAGRFAIVDTFDSHIDTLTEIGQPDLNAFTTLESVQGYGSILSQEYGTATGTHTLDSISRCALAHRVFVPLRLATLVLFAGELARGVGADGRALPPQPPCRGAAAPGTAERRTFYLGWAVSIDAATLVTAGHHRPFKGVVGVLTPSGGTRFPALTMTRTRSGWAVRFRRPQLAAGLVIEGTARSVSDTSTVTGTDGGRWAFDGLLQDEVGTSAWRYEGIFDNAFGVFAATHVQPPVWIGDGAAGSTVSQVRSTDWGSAVDHVVASRPVTVVWSEAYSPGWHAVLTPWAGGAAGGARLTVHRRGLIQSVRVPKGTWTLTFVYRPPHLTLGIAGSLVGIGGFVVLGGVAVADRRRKRRRRASVAPPSARV